VFTSGVDPVRAGLVSSFSQPEGNVTGVSWFSGELGAKHLELVCELRHWRQWSRSVHSDWDGPMGKAPRMLAPTDAQARWSPVILIRSWWP
jgi:hypothetical protein